MLVGMSQGGYLSLRCALIHPEVVRALVLIDTQAMLEDPEQMPHHEALLRAWMGSRRVRNARGLPSGHGRARPS